MAVNQISSWAKPRDNIVFKLFFSFLLIFIICLLPVYSQETCGAGSIPRIITPGIYKASINESFIATIGTAQVNSTITYSLVPVKSFIPGIEIGKETGIIEFTPNQTNSGVSIFLIVAATDQGCYDTKTIEIIVYDKPKITQKEPAANAVDVRATDSQTFFINATSSAPPLFYDWYLDNKRVATGNSFTYASNYSDNGLHSIKALVRDIRGQNTTQEWFVTVKNKNRPPYIKYYFPNLALSDNTGKTLLNIYDYISDPDYDKLSFEPIYMDPYNPSLISDASNYFSIIINAAGDMGVTWNNVPLAAQGVMIRATDPSNESVTSVPFYLKVAQYENYTYYMLNTTVNETEDCKVAIICKEWSNCLPTSIKTRDCYDYHNCNKENTTYTEYQSCDYLATCFDSIKNQGEQGVDCGGPCKACESCEDGIQNHGETAIDCGGPCRACPSCDDGIKNQNETGIDCGGPCSPCAAGMGCLEHKDCQSFVCSNSTCQQPSCLDSRMNQGETGIDCGGPCKACQTCYDGIMNQGEAGIDCGGPCKPCQTCNDGIKNQGEFFADCGGPCKACSLPVIVSNFRIYLIIFTLLFIISAVYIIIKTRYEQDKIGFFIDFSRLFGFLPKRIPRESHKIVNTTIARLQEIKKDIMAQEDNVINENYIKAVNEFYSGLFEIQGDFSIGILRHSIASHITNPFLVRLFLEIYEEALRLRPEKSFFKIELQEKIIGLVAILSKIQDLI